MQACAGTRGYTHILNADLSSEVLCEMVFPADPKKDLLLPSEVPIER